MNLEEELLKIKAKISENGVLPNTDCTEFTKPWSVIQENLEQQKTGKANKNSTKDSSNKTDLKNISTNSKTIQRTKLSRNDNKQTKVPCFPENQNQIKSKQRRNSTKQNQFQFVDTNAPNVDKKCDIKQGTTEMTIQHNQDQIELDDSIFDVFADLKDSRKSIDDDDDDNIDDDYLYSKNPEFLCEICSKIFENRSNYNRHINWMHQNQEYLYLCTRCPKTLNSLPELIKHIKEHKARRHRRIVCDICGVEKTNQSHLDDHIRTHFEERAFICHICTSSFKTKSALKIHLKRHSGVKNYKCEQCDAEFFDCSDYKRHLVKHGAIQKEFHCSICGNSFYERKLLRHHIIKVHNICNGEELKFLPEFRDLHASRFRFLQKKERETIKKPRKPRKSSKSKTIQKTAKSPKLSKKTKHKIDILEIYSINDPINDYEAIVDLNKVSETSKIKEEVHIEEETFHLDDVETNEFINFENNYDEISDTKATSIDGDADATSINEYKNIPEINVPSTLNECVTVELNISEIPNEIKCDGFSKQNNPEDTVCSSLNNVQKSLQLISLAAESSNFNKEKLQFVHHKIGIIVGEIHKLLEKIPKLENDNIAQFLPLNDIETLEQKLNDESFNKEFRKHFKICYPQTSPNDLEDIEKILSDSFLKQYSGRKTRKRRFTDYECVMSTLYKIWAKKCGTYKEFAKLMRSQVWKVMQAYKMKHKAQQ